MCALHCQIFKIFSKRPLRYHVLPSQGSMCSSFAMFKQLFKDLKFDLGGNLSSIPSHSGPAAKHRAHPPPRDLCSVCGAKGRELRRSDPPLMALAAKMARFTTWPS